MSVGSSGFASVSLNHQFTYSDNNIYDCLACVRYPGIIQTMIKIRPSLPRALYFKHDFLDMQNCRTRVVLDILDNFWYEKVIRSI